MNAAAELSALGLGAIAPLVGELEDPNPSVRLRAARALLCVLPYVSAREAPDAQALAVRIGAHSGLPDHERAAALWLLRSSSNARLRLPHREVTDRLRGLQRDPSEFVRQGAARLLMFIDGA